MRTRAITVILLAVLTGCQPTASAPPANPLPTGSLGLHTATLRLGLAMPRKVQALPDFWDQANVVVDSARLKTSLGTTLSTATTSLAPVLSLPTGEATVSIDLRAQGVVIATGMATASLVAGPNVLTVTMAPFTDRVLTLAGNGATGASDGLGAAARFNGPRGLALDGAGNLYVADTSNHVIRRITPGGLVTTLAGSGATGSLDATGPAASFYAPSGVAVDAGGALYVADTLNHKIRKITPGGDVLTLAGSGSVGVADNASASLATFNQPWGIALDAGGNVYVADFGNDRLRKISPAGAVTTLVTSGLSGPSGLAIDSAGNVIVADYFDSRILKVSPGGTVIPIGGTGTAGFAGDGGPASAAQFNQPRAVAVDAADNVFVADTFNYRIRKILAGSGIVSTVAGNGSSGFLDGSAGATQFGALFGLAARGTGLRLYAADSANQRIRVHVGP